MKEPMTAGYLGAAAMASLGTAAAIEHHTVLLFGVPLSLLLAVLAGALFAATLLPGGSRIGAVMRVLGGTWLGAYTAPAVIYWADPPPGAPTTHKFIAMLCGALVLLLLEGLLAVARRAPGDLWARALTWLDRKSGKAP